jgi:hypothetical protein
VTKVRRHVIDPRGYVKVDERLRTSADGVWALGECAGSPQFTHVSFDDFRVVRDGLAGKERTTRETGWFRTARSPIRSLGGWGSATPTRGGAASPRAFSGCR